MFTELFTDTQMSSILNNGTANTVSPDGVVTWRWQYTTKKDFSCKSGTVFDMNFKF